MSEPTEPELLQEPKEEEIVEPGSELDEAAARLLRGAWRSSPGVVLSLIFHGAVLSVLPAIVFYEKLREPAVHPVTIGVDAKRIDPDRNYKPVSGGPPSSDGRGLDEPPVFFPDALPAERNESESKVDRSKIEGDEQAILVHTTNEALSGARGRRNDLSQFGSHFTMGVGGGSGRDAKRFGTEGGGGRRNLAARGGGSAATEQAVDWGLGWLARHQHANGSFPTEVHRCGTCTGVAILKRCDVAATALAVDAFLIAGYAPGHDDGETRKDAATGRSLRYSETVRTGLSWLCSKQKKDGLVGDPAWGQEGTWPTVMYGHAFATMTLCDAARITSSTEYAKAAMAAVRWLERAQNPGAGWQYGPRDGGSDMSVTGACVQAVRAAKLAGIALSPATIEGITRFTKRVTNAKGRGGYSNKDDMDRPALTAISVYTRRFLGEKLDGLEHQEVRRFVANVATPEGTSDYYNSYYSMLALFETEGPQGKNFKRCNERVTTDLVRAQHRPTDGCSAGSWECRQDAFMKEAGRTTTTALNVLTLEVYYRYAMEKSTSR